MSALPPRHASASSTLSVQQSAADSSTRWWSMGTKRPSLKNLLLGLPSSSWSSRSPPSAAIADEQSVSTAQPATVVDAASTADVAATDDEASATPLPATDDVTATADTADTTAVPSTATDGEVVESVGGGKTIDYWGSVALLVNNVTGGGMVLFAQTFQQAGWLLMVLCLLVLMVCCGLGGLMLVECMAMMPHNGRFTRRVEYTTVMKHYCSRYVYIAISVFYQLSLTITNLSLIVQSIQVMDFTIAAVAGRSCTVPQFYPTFAFACPEPVQGNITPFDSSVWCVPLGLYFTALIVIPLGLINLDDNIKVQKGAFFSLCVILLIWVGLLSSNSPDGGRVPVVGSTLSSVLGVSLFNFAFLSSVPSWVNEKRDDVSIPKTLWTVLPLSVVMFVVMGWLGGAAFVWTANSNETLLDKVKDVTTAGKLGEVTFYLFPIIVNLTSIPVLSIFQRYNLVKEGVCGLRMANFLAVVLPWLLAIPLYNGSGYQELANWGGVLVTSVVNFIVPITVYIVAVRRREKEATNVHHLRELQPATETDAQIQPQPSVESAITAAAAGAVQEAEQKPAGKKLVKKLSVSSAVEWMRSLGTKKDSGSVRDDDASDSGLRPSPMHHFTGNAASSSFSIASTHTSSDTDSELVAPTHSPDTPSRVATTASPTPATTSTSSNSSLSVQALRWAAEADKQRATNSASAASLSNSIPRDAIQPASGSLRLARAPTPPAPSSPLPSSHPSQRNLLSGLTSSFSVRSLMDEPGLEMTPVSSAIRPDEKVDDEKVELADDFLDVGAIQVEEVGQHDDDEDDEQQQQQHEEDEEKVRAPGHDKSYASASAGASLPAISEAVSEHSVSQSASGAAKAAAALDLEERIRQEQAADQPYAAESVVDLVTDDERGQVWHVVKKEWEPYRVPVAVAVLAVMVVLSVLALEQQIQVSVENPGW